MKVAIFDRGVCGIEQTFYLGTVNKDTDAAEGTQLPVKLPAGFRIVGFGADGVYDATTNPFPSVLVQAATHQYTANKVAI